MTTNSIKLFSAVIILCAFILTTGCKTQKSTTTKPEVKNATANTLIFLAKQNDIVELEKQYPLITVDNKRYIGAMMLVDSNYNETAVKQIGVLIGTKNGNIVSVKIPIDKVREVLALAFVQNLDVDSKISIK